MDGEQPASPCRLDLRFIPDAQSFAGRAPRDAAGEAPQGYEPPPAFATAALQHSRVRLTWDATPDERKRAMSRRVRPEELRDDDFKVGCGGISVQTLQSLHVHGYALACIGRTRLAGRPGALWRRVIPEAPSLTGADVHPLAQTKASRDGWMMAGMCVCL